MDEKKLLIRLQDPTLWLALLNDSTCKIRFEIWTEIEFCSSGLFISRGKTLFLLFFIAMGNLDSKSVGKKLLR